MFILHYILPLIIFYFYRNKTMLYGLLIGNLIDLDHIYIRLIGKLGWFESACQNGLGSQCSFSVYPLHSFPVITSFFILAIVSYNFYKSNMFWKWVFWISLGALFNYLLDYIHLISGIVI